jgi:hypothetical protein
MTNPLAPNPETDIDNPEVHKHQVPIVNIDDTDQKALEETLEHEPPEKVEEDLLILDEADALFGKRGGVKDSHDRY